MQKRFTRKIDLEMLLSQAEPHPSPRPSLEQYTIPADVAATMLHVAAYVKGDIVDKSVLDLGCGTGRLALGAAFLGAKRVVGVDIDKTAVSAALSNSTRTGLKESVQWITADIGAIRGSFDTVVQNPPYGIQDRKADRRFLEKALEVGETIYSLHKGLQTGRAFIGRLKTDPNGIVPVVPSPFIRDFVEMHGGRINAVYAMVMTIPHMFSFHSKRRYEFVADLYIMNGKGDSVHVD